MTNSMQPSEPLGAHVCCVSFPPLTMLMLPRNNTRAWHPQHCVTSFTLSRIEEHYERRLQPQGGRRIGARQQDRRRGGRTHRERDPRVHQIPERRSCARGAAALEQSSADGQRKAHRVGRLYGEARSVCSETGLRRSTLSGFESLGSKVTFRVTMMLIVLLALLLASACGHPKQARVAVPPAPASESPGSTTANEGGRNASVTPSHPSSVDASSADRAEPQVPADSRPLATEVGRASWYGPPYHHRVGS